MTGKGCSMSDDMKARRQAASGASRAGGGKPMFVWHQTRDSRRGVYIKDVPIGFDFFPVTTTGSMDVSYNSAKLYDIKGDAISLLAMLTPDRVEVLTTMVYLPLSNHFIITFRKRMGVAADGYSPIYDVHALEFSYDPVLKPKCTIVNKSIELKKNVKQYEFSSKEISNILKTKFESVVLLVVLEDEWSEYHTKEYIEKYTGYYYDD
jgi:hypothetical protein